jgi:hypothetical protein
MKVLCKVVIAAFGPDPVKDGEGYSARGHGRNA